MVQLLYLSKGKILFRAGSYSAILKVLQPELARSLIFLISLLNINESFMLALK